MDIKREIYISAPNGSLSLAEYISGCDDAACYGCWCEEETQKGYNFKFTKTFEEFRLTGDAGVKSRLTSSVIRNADGAVIGAVFISSPETPPDLAIMIYRPYRNRGYGTKAFALGAKYAFETLGLDRIYAGCYPDNTASMKMIKKCGFTAHPEGNINEKHYITGGDIIQLDFVKHNICN